MQPFFVLTRKMSFNLPHESNRLRESVIACHDKLRVYVTLQLCCCDFLAQSRKTIQRELHLFSDSHCELHVYPKSQRC